jgi:hypothetical protein
METNSPITTKIATNYFEKALERRKNSIGQDSKNCGHYKLARKKRESRVISPLWSGFNSHPQLQG